MIGDVVLNNFISGFSIEHEIESLSDDKKFEHFANYAVLSRLYDGTVDLDALDTDRAAGIDGIAIIVNDSIIVTREEIAEISRHSLEARFVFVQAKTSRSFDSGEWHKFANAVDDFFKDEEHVPPPNNRMAHFRDLRAAVFEQSIKMTEGAPSCDLYYVYTGGWNANDASARSLIEKTKQSLMSHRTGLGEVRIVVVDLEKLKEYYRSIKQRAVKQLCLEKRAVIPKVEGVQQAFIGVVPATEYIKLITDPDGNIERHLFYENVRDFLGNNPVNADIFDSIQDDSVGQDKFALLNNGVTIVASSITPVGDTLTLKNFQVVNGCQTSHALFYSRGHIGEKLYLPIKLIATDDQELTGRIIKATNWQTQVTQEAFVALEPFQKRIEEYFAAVDAVHRIYYERRAKQYEALATPKLRVITIPTQINCFVATYLSEPQSTHRYYGELLRSNHTKIFRDEHDPLPYYLCSYAMFRIMDEFRQGRLPARMKPFRYLLVYTLRLLCLGAGELDLSLRTKGVAPLFEKFRATLQDTVEFGRVLAEGHRAIERVLDSDPDGSRFGRDANRRSDFTAAVRGEIERERKIEQIASVPRSKDALSQSAATPAAHSGRERGKIVLCRNELFSSDFVFGFIRDQRDIDHFFHQSDWRGVAPPTWGQLVEFTPRPGPRGPKASEVFPIDNP